MVNWYKHDIPAWMDGTEALDDAPYRVYHVICQLIYLNEGPIALNEHGIAGRCKQSIRTFRAALKCLFDAEKLVLQDGKIDNPRAKKELEKVSENRLNASKGGLKSSEVRSLPNKSLKINGEVQASLQEVLSLKEKTREEKKEKRERAAKAPYSEEFEKGFWQVYPTSPTMSKKEAWQVWQRLSPEKRDAACKAVEPYKRSMASKPQFIKHACRFLSTELFEGFVSNGTTLAPVIDIRSHIV